MLALAVDCSFKCSVPGFIPLGLPSCVGQNGDLGLLLPINFSAQLLHADAKSSGNSTHRWPGWSYLAPLDAPIGSKRQIGHVANSFLGHIAGFA
jgi:hypothetical protein